MPRTAGNNRTQRGDPYTVTTLRLSPDMRADLQRLQDISDRTLGWLATQAIRQLFRDLEGGFIVPAEVGVSLKGLHAAKVLPPGYIPGDTFSVQLFLPCVLMDWLARLMASSPGKQRSAIIRFALQRYIAKRRPLLSGRAPYIDSLLEAEPEMSPL